MKKSLFALAALVFTTMLAGCEKEDKDSISKSDVNKGIVMIEGRNGKEFATVDLGLSSGILWATCNIGASSPEETGNYYAWGEIEPKQEYTKLNYKWWSDKYDTYTRGDPNTAADWEPVILTMPDSHPLKYKWKEPAVLIFQFTTEKSFLMAT